jgi:hypothetical protein
VAIGALGDAALNSPGLGSTGGRWALLGGGLIATVAAIILVTRKARALLRETGVISGSTSQDG